MNRFFRYATWAVLPLLVSPLGARNKGITREQADEILNELRQIRQLLEKQAAAGPQQTCSPFCLMALAKTTLNSCWRKWKS